MSKTALLAEHIENQTDTILGVWRATVEDVGDVPESEKLSNRDFNDHVPALLDRLAERLRGRDTDALTEGRKHGALRWRQGYDIAEIVRELDHLRTALTRSTAQYAIEQGWEISRLETAYEVINEVLAEATAESVRQFQEDSVRETQNALDEVRQREQALDEVWSLARGEQAKVHSILASLPVAVWVVNAEGSLVGVNKEAERLLDAPLGEFVGRLNVLDGSWEPPMLRLDGTPIKAAEMPINRALRGEVVKQEEVVWVVQGAKRTFAINAAPVTNTEGDVIGAVRVVQDITARIELEQLLEKQKELAEESSRHKSRLVSALSHDARTPLNAVVLAAQLLEIHLDGDAHSEVQECLRTIRHSVGNVLDLLRDLLNLSRIDAGALPAELSRFPLEQVLAECLASIEPQGHQKGLAIRFEPGPLAGVSVETDRAKLKQILANLLSNALRYTERGHIRLYGERSGDHIRIAVEDTGVGISADDQERIFVEFATLDNSQRKIGEGTGLGLAICRRLASLLRGEITLRSTPGAGSTFALVLPISVMTLTIQPPESPALLNAPGSGVIVVAEDHPDSRQTLAKVLRRMGYRVLEADNGRDALALIEQERPIAVLMDVNMPVMDGIEATQALRNDPRFTDLPIFALTGDVTLENQLRIGDAGVQGYLEKPVTWEVLRQALSTLQPS